ncbi:hypothetical protein VP01_4106g3 [Puccinia sorghi]|uniref:DDE Tnp4 domain-containing protein n=1 Tax=Puccinia sorghi TaxID=27349 RepID=A0A0L6UR94_9BASI|nr:hypothetical protein VP01_4106g3 [Puccinia sorghi]
MDPMDLTHLVSIPAMWHHMFHVAFDCGPQWEPWNNHCIPHVRFVELFRMSLADFDWLAEEIRNNLAQDPIGCGQPLSVEAQVGVGLYGLAHGSSFVTIGHIFMIGKETADKACSQFFNAVIKVLRFRVLIPLLHLSDFLPLTSQNNGVKSCTLLRGGKVFHRLLVLLMGPIAMPPDDNWKSYVNRKSWASIVFHKGGAGSMHDSRVFRRSRLGKSLRSGATVAPMILQGTFLVGDAGYPSNVKILLPYPMVVEPANKFFNYVQSSTQIVVEQAFGRLKHRFRLLLSSQNLSPARARNNSFACMILHNILNRRGSLYVHCWDSRHPQELVFAKLPDTPVLNTIDEDPMNTKRDIICDFLYHVSNDSTT